MEKTINAKAIRKSRGYGVRIYFLSKTGKIEPNTSCLLV